MGLSDVHSECDVLVVGAGGAGLAAALSARESGAHVMVIEKAPRELTGGNTRFSGGLFRAPYSGLADLVALVGRADDPAGLEAAPYSAENYIDDLARATGGRVDRELGRVLVAESYDSLRWLAGHGVRFAFNRAIGTAPTRDGGPVRLPDGAGLIARGEGEGLAATLLDLVEKQQIPVIFDTQALAPLIATDGSVEGVRVRGRRGGVVRSRSVVMACGGFHASAAWRCAFLGPEFSYVKVRGTQLSTGEFLLGTIACGAQSFGDWGSAHVAPVDADATSGGDPAIGHSTNRLSFPYGIMIDLDGERFIDEGANFSLYQYVNVGRALLTRRDRLAFQVFDARTSDLLEARYSTATPIRSDSLAGLLATIEDRYPHQGFAKARGERTIEEYNAAIQPGRMVPDQLDGNTTLGLDPDKTNWAQPVDTPPFVAYPVTAGITFTYGGVRTDGKARVLDDRGAPIPGLFAAGEAMGGFFSGNYPGGASLGRNAVFGRIAGAEAARSTASD